MARQMLDDRQDAARKQRLADHPAPAGDLIGIMPKSPAADDLVAAGRRDIEQRCAVHINTDSMKLAGNDAIAEPESLTGARLGLLVTRVMIEQRGDIAPALPMRRAEPLHAPALLIDENGRIPPDRFAEFGRQPRKLIRINDIPCEKDEAPRIGLAEEGGFVTCQPGAGEAEDRGRGHALTRSGQRHNPARVPSAPDRRRGPPTHRQRARRAGDKTWRRPSLSSAPPARGHAGYRNWHG